MICPACGDEMDDFGVCACVFATSHTPKPPDAKGRFIGSMREMVQRKMALKARAKETT